MPPAVPRAGSGPEAAGKCAGCFAIGICSLARKDDRYAISGSLTYKLNRLMQLQAEVREEWLRSTVPGVDYAATAMLLGLRVQR